MASPVIDVHTHMFSSRWLEMLAQHGGPHLAYRPNPASDKISHLRGRCAVHDAHPGHER